MFNLNIGDSRPLYLQIKEHFKELILTGAMREGEKMSSVREMAAGLAINPNTIQKAYKELEAEGYIFSVPAKGSFVAPAKNRKNTLRLDELRQELAGLVKEMRYLGENRESVIAQIENIFKEEKL